jgi:hypothetical protein
METLMFRFKVKMHITKKRVDLIAREEEMRVPIEGPGVAAEKGTTTIGESLVEMMMKSIVMTAKNIAIIMP